MKCDENSVETLIVAALQLRDPQGRLILVNFTDVFSEEFLKENFPDHESLLPFLTTKIHKGRDLT